MEAQPPMGINGDSGDRAYDHIRFRARYRARQGTHVTGGMVVHGGVRG